MKLLSVAEKDVLKMRLATAEKIMAYNGASPDDYRALRDAGDALDAAYARIAQLESEPDEAMLDVLMEELPLDDPCYYSEESQKKTRATIRSAWRASLAARRVCIPANCINRQVDAHLAARKPADTP